MEIISNVNERFNNDVYVHSMEIVTKKGNRLNFIDNLRVYLTILVILHHTAIMFGGAGGWAIRVEADKISTIIFSLFNAMNQSYFMALFFLLSAYFTKASLQRKDTKNILKDRFVKLGIPILVFIIFLAPLTNYIIFYPKYSVVDYYVNMIHNIDISTGHLWFLQALLVFLLGYIAFRKFFPKSLKVNVYDLISQKKLIFLIISGLSLGTFIIRILFPVGIVIANFQLGHFTHYIIFYCLGLLAYNSKFFDEISFKNTKFWHLSSLILLPLLIVFLVVTGALENGLNPYMGGISYQAFLYSIWESIALISFSVTAITIFKSKFNKHHSIQRFFVKNSYLSYILHPSVILVLGVIIIPYSLHPIVSFIIVGVVGTVLTYLLSHNLRKLPWLKKVVG